MATYYVDTASSGGNGTTQATSGANAAFATIAAVNAASFSAGDSILFKKGCTWREQLTVPSSGSEGSPITFGAYGSGDDPIITGSVNKDAEVDWTQEEATVPNLVANGDAETGDFTSWTETDSGNDLDISSTEHHAGSYSFHCVDNDTTANYASQTITTTSLFDMTCYAKFNMAGSANNWIQYAAYYSGGTQIGLLQCQISGGYVQLQSRTFAGGNNSSSYYNLTNDANWHKIQVIVNVVGGGAGYHKLYIDDVEKHNAGSLTFTTLNVTSVRIGTTGLFGSGTYDLESWWDDFYVAGTPGDENFYYTSPGATPLVMWRDGARMTKVTNKVDVDAVTKWWWDGASKVYLHDATGNPASGHTYEIPIRASCITATDKDYVKLSNLDLRYANTYGLDVIVNAATCTGWEVDSCNVQGIFNIPIYIGHGAAAINKVDGAYVHDCTLSDFGGLTTAAQNGISIYYGDSVKINDNTLVYSDLGNNGRAYAIEYRFSSATGGSPTPEILRNTVSGATSLSARGYSLYTSSTYYGKMSYNHVTAAMPGGGGISLDENAVNANNGPNNWEISYNYVAPASLSYIGIIMEADSSNNSIFYNIVDLRSCGAAAQRLLWIRGNSQGNHVYNNTFLFPDDCMGTQLGSNAVDVAGDKIINNVFKNNIYYLESGTARPLIVVEDQNGSDLTGVLFDYNLYNDPDFTTCVQWVGNNYNSIAAWNAVVSSQEAHHVEGDPLFVSSSDFHLQSSSPCINAGVDVGLTTDIEGNPISGNPDIGAYERQPGGIGIFGRMPRSKFLIW